MTEIQMNHAEVKTHPPILLLLSLMAAFLLNWLFPLPIALPDYFRASGILIAAAGFASAFMAVRQFGVARTTLDPHGSVGALVTSGPYRFSRNPIYLGFICVLIGLPLAFGSYWGALLSPVLVLALNGLVIQYEEAYLENKFKDQYTGYRSRVRRWL